MTAVLLSACHAWTPLSEFESTLPLVVVDTSGEEMGRKRASIEDDSWVGCTIEVVDDVGPCGIHVRGNSSRDYAKVSYRLELRDASGADRDAPLLGMPPEADWVLQGPYSDKTLMRNALMYQLSRDIGVYAARTRFVELFVVDDDREPSTRHHRGIYVLTEKIERDPSRVEIDKLEPDDLSGGYLLKRDWVEDEGSQVLKTPRMHDKLIVDDPDPITSDQRIWLLQWFSDFERALDGPGWDDPTKGYQAWVDLDSFVDHMLLVELGRSVDGYVLSTWMSKDRGGPLTMGPIWDYNGALGNADYFEAWRTKGWHYDNPDFPADNRQGFAWYERMLTDPSFLARRAERWHAHRAGPWSDEAVRSRISEARGELAEAAPRNFEVWDVLGEYVWPNDEGAEERETWDDEVDYLTAWLLDRLSWIDGAVD